MKLGWTAPGGLHLAAGGHPTGGRGWVQPNSVAAVDQPTLVTGQMLAMLLGAALLPWQARRSGAHAVRGLAAAGCADLGGSVAVGWCGLPVVVGVVGHTRPPTSHGRTWQGLV